MNCFEGLTLFIQLFKPFLKFFFVLRAKVPDIIFVDEFKFLGVLVVLVFAVPGYNFGVFHVKLGIFLEFLPIVIEIKIFS